MNRRLVHPPDSVLSRCQSPTHQGISVLVSMNISSIVVRDDLTTAVLKNVIIVTLFFFINYINATLMYTFMRHEIFNMNPRYILYINLIITDIGLLTILTISHVLSYIIYTLKVWLCIILFFVGVTTNVNNPMTLAVMAIECYVAVCFPLRHSQIITVKKTYIVIGFLWLLSMMFFLPDLFMSLTIEPIDFFQSRVFCLKKNILRMPIFNIKDTIMRAVLLVAVCLILIYTYFKILFTAKSASADAKKARNTVLLHSFQLMLSMLTYVNDPISVGLTLLFPQSVLAIRFAVAIIVNVMPRLISPLIYGIRDKEFKKYLKRYLVCKSY